MSLETRFVAAAAADPTISAFLGSGSPLVMRLYNTQLVPGAYKLGTCARYLRVSTMPIYGAQGQLSTNWVRMQIDVLDASAVQAITVADALLAWLGRVSFGPISTQFANFFLNQRGGLEPQTQPPIFVRTLDVRIFNLED